MYNHQLDTFLEVAECGSISAAAKRHYVSQSAVTQQIASLESRLGVRLFDRTNRGMRPTEAGELLVARAKEMVDLSARTLADLAKLAVASENCLVVSSGHVVHRFVFELVSETVRRHPEVSATFASPQALMSVDDVAAGIVDVCVCCRGEKLRQSGMLFTPLFEDDEICAVPTGSPLAKRESVGLDDLDGFQVIMPPPGYADSSDMVYGQLERHPGVKIISTAYHPKRELLAVDDTFAAVALRHHRAHFSVMEIVAFRGSARAVVGLACLPDHKRAVGELLEVAREKFPDGASL